MTTKALVLMSGGLDSLLAVKVLQEQGVQVTAISFVTPFFGAGNARRASEALGIDLIVEEITDEHLAMVKKPPHGYGKYMNPCIDCHTLMVKVAGALMEREGYDFVATGEVLGERPMSQNFQSLMDVSRNSGYADYLVRPLSAKLLPETKPEKDGKLDRERLLDIQGRSRKPQMELVNTYGIKEYVQPAGGCLLTDPHFSDRLRDLLKHQPDAGNWECDLLRMGRHFRLAGGTKVVVGRNEKDNDEIERMARPNDVLIIAESVPGPSTLIVGGGDDELIAEVGRLTAAYAKAGGSAIVMNMKRGSEVTPIEAKPGERREWEPYRI